MLTESDLTFKKAIEIARSMELARKDCTELNMGRVLLDHTEALVNTISTSKNNSRQKSYCKSHKDDFAEPEVKLAGLFWHCGDQYSHRSCRRLKNSKCYICSAVGHIASKCNTRFKKAHYVDDYEASDSESEGELYGIYTISDKCKEIKDSHSLY